jgi:multiple sugar transport system substrate-binding protein
LFVDCLDLFCEHYKPKGEDQVMRFRYMSWLSVCGMLCGLILSACATPAAPAAAGQPAQGQTDAEGPSGEVVWWALAEFNFEAYVDQVEEAYEAHSPNVDLQIEILPEESYLERILPTLASGEGPDIVILEFVPALTRPTTLLELNAYIDGPDGLDLSQWDEAAMADSAILDGKIYGLPRDLWGARGWFINKDIFDRNSVPYPQQGWTVSELRAIAPQLSDKENRVYGVAVPTFWGVGLNQWGVRFVSDDSRTVTGYLDSPEAIAHYHTIKELYDCCSPTVDQQATEFQDVGGGGMGPLGAFIADRTAIGDIDPGVHQVLTDASINWGFVPFPLADEPSMRNRPYQNYVHWGVNKNSDNPDATWDFLKWLTAKDGAQPIMAQAGYFVPFRENLEAAGYPTDILDVVFYEPPAEWGEPIRGPWGGRACVGEAVVPEMQAITEQVLAGTPEQIDTIVREGTQRAQEALDACWEKQEAGEGS